MSTDVNSEVGVCLLCNSDQVHLKHKGNYRSRVSSEVISICTRYLPEEVTAKMNAEIDRQIVEAIDSPIFCYFCFENSWILSKLNTQLEEIQSQINNHVAAMILQTNEQKEKMKMKASFVDVDSESKCKTSSDEIFTSPSKLEDSSTDTDEEIGISNSESFSSENNFNSEKNSSSTKNAKAIDHTYTKNRCGYCSKAFTCSINLSRHIQSSHNNKEHICGKCGEGFQRSSQLIIHTVNVHDDSRSLLCGTCGKSFNHLHELLNHKVQEHSKKHKCRECGLSFEHLVLLEEHLRTHDNTVTKVVNVSTGENISSPSSYTIKEEELENYENPEKRHRPEAFNYWVDGETEIVEDEMQEQEIKIEIDDCVVFKVEPDN